MVDFHILAQDRHARCGHITTAHGTIDTPCFMPVGTYASIKGVESTSVTSTGTHIILANTYHLIERPGCDVIERHLGLHNFMQWHKPILTDSGGFQIWSLARLCDVDDHGASFRSPIDGHKRRLTPQSVIEAQYLFNSTISMVLDMCVPWDSDTALLEQSVHRTCRWASSSLEHYQQRHGYGLFAIIQGGLDENLRRRCAETLATSPFHGYAIGGLSVGEHATQRNRTLDATIAFMPQEKPRYLMGVGRPLDILDAVKRGIDMVDCVLPTRCGRTAKAFTWDGEINMMNACHRYDTSPLDPTCPCPLCTHYSKSYLHHLFKKKEILAATLLTLHNLFFYQSLMAKIRQSIINKRFDSLYEQIRQRMTTPR
ncbi:MAG: tRNA guanosine(34) transglycosylase Tgt [Alphaproteobacteria bacterium GM7ARS4]|nr:tRNA guanosine(34) transglycosylase Tgt [Alphaproteobacteria bacterium GM7ARS4]